MSEARLAYKTLLAKAAEAKEKVRGKSKYVVVVQGYSKYMDSEYMVSTQLLRGRKGQGEGAW